MGSRKLLIITTALTFLLSTLSPANANNPPRKILSGWLPDYSLARNLPTVEGNLDLIRDISPFWYGLTGESSIKDKYALGKYTTPKEQVIARLKANGVLLLPTITDDNKKFVLANLLANPTSRSNIVQTIKSLVLKYNYDGIDLDFETFYTQDGRSSWAALKPNWIAFIKELSTALHDQGKLLSVTTPPDFAPETKRAGNWIYSWAEIGPLIDRLRIMAYDFSTTSPGPIGPLPWTEDGVKYAINQMPASKVFLGIPGYGRDWITKVEGVCPKDFTSSVVVGAKAAVVMREAPNLAASNNALPTYNTTNAESTFTYKKTYVDPTNSASFCTASRTVWYPDERSYAARTNLVGKYRLGGIAVWTFGMENTAAITAIRDIAKSIAPDQVIGTLSTDLEEIGYGSTFNLTGTFKLPDKTPVPALNVRFEIKNSSDNNWRTLSAGVTDLAGVIAFPIILGQKSQIRLVSEGSWERTEGKTIEKVISVVPNVSLSLPASIKVATSYTVFGQVLPKVAGIKLVVKQNMKPLGEFITDASGGFSFEIKAATTGLATYQVVISAGEKNTAAISDEITILVR
ncbi:glycosylhydrolase [Candidatus Nanopelagicus abundans]|uniref:Glycosylhydrolase n=1 Tax=Candidatus Nanopelagicus abundans TaxID=1884916 RepID=A0A249L523_9ACTN|nr:glycosyl hydrolase family 18 protein [Candidatus Nanopelagicus abundans]ASY24198.1 glycosylhydrolase [Candidatus Nanopelagicus abundans]